MPKILSSLLEISRNQVKKSGCQHFTFSIFATLNYVAPMFVAHMPETLDFILIGLRVAAVILCFGLIFADYWPKDWRQKYFTLYWYITLCFCLPFLSTYTVFVTAGGEWWMFNAILSLLLLIMLTDWQSFIILSVLGVTLALILYLPLGIDVKYYIPPHDIYLFGYLCAFILLSAFLFMRRKEDIQMEKIEVMKIFGSAIAHEVNSPLAAIQMLAMTLSDITGDITLQSEEEIVDGDRYYIIRMGAVDYEMLIDTIPCSLTRTSQEASKIVEMLLLALKDKFGGKEGTHSLASIIKEVMDDYGFVDEQRKRIDCSIERDIEFFGSKQMIKHVIYNLIRNALKYGGKNVTIRIWIEGNRLHFMDNGHGIDAKEIKKVFDSFYTNSGTGTGIGLAFCNTVMKSIGGSIECKSQLGEYTEFILHFPTEVGYGGAGS